MIAERAGQGGLTVERMCGLSGVSRAGFYRHWEASAPRQADTALRDALQQVALEKRFYGYRRVQHELRQRGHWVNAKRVLRLMREDNLRQTILKVPRIALPAGVRQSVAVVVVRVAARQKTWGCPQVSFIG